MMDRWRNLSLTCLLLIFGLTACEGGSGSSGFDVRSENDAIQAALTGQRCVQHESLTICPAEAGTTPSPTSPPAAANTPTPSFVPPEPTATPNNAFTPGEVPTATASPAATAATTPTLSRTPTISRSATPTASATPTNGVQQVDIDIDVRAPVVCAPTQDGGCTFGLPFAVSGFSPATSFLVAVRTVNPNGRWMVSDVLTPSEPATAVFTAPIDISAPVSSCCGTTVQVAVLVFFNPPADVPATVAELVDTGADNAFVTQPFTVQTVTSDF
jgi:hypothetical protein